MAAVREWFRNYKLPEGLPNAFLAQGRYFGAAKAASVIAEQHHNWLGLVARNPEEERPPEAAFARFWWPPHVVNEGRAGEL